MRCVSFHIEFVKKSGHSQIISHFAQHKRQLKIWGSWVNENCYPADLKTVIMSELIFAPAHGLPTHWFECEPLNIKGPA